MYLFIYLFIWLFIDTDNAFQINHTNKSFHVFAPNLSDKNNWLSNLKKFMAKAQKGQGQELIKLINLFN